MYSAKGCIEEIYLSGAEAVSAARLSCPAGLVPAPGQYLLAQDPADPRAALALPVFSAGVCPGGFLAAPPLPTGWLPGMELELRGPYGHGFSLPASARRVALVACDGGSARLLALLDAALGQKAAVTLLTDTPPAGLPAALEISPLASLPEIARWADYLAIDLRREQLPEWLPLLSPLFKGGYAQLLIGTPLPCAGLAECGVCAIRTRSGYRLACKDGPVFDLSELEERVK